MVGFDWFILAGFIVLFLSYIWSAIENRSLRQQISDLRVAKSDMGARLYYKDREVAMWKGAADTATKVANERLNDKLVVEGMNRILLEEREQKIQAATKRREAAASRREQAAPRRKKGR